MVLTEKESYFVFTGNAMKNIYETVERVAKTDEPILVSGESGTGKEIIARLIHDYSGRAHRPYIDVNCAAIPETLMEAHLFGSEPGAFTDAKKTVGSLKEADNGTIFLDEISEMPYAAQSKLLRALQERRFRPIGGKIDVHSDFRIVASTNRPVEKMLEDKVLRDDLYYRISTIELYLPPLRERVEDIPHLANFLLNKYRTQIGKQVDGFSSEVLELFQHFPWPGNIRQFYNAIKSAIIRTDNAIIERSDLDKKIRCHQLPSKERLPIGRLAQVEMQTIINTLEECDGNQLAAAKVLGISRGTLFEKRRQIENGTFGKKKPNNPNYRLSNGNGHNGNGNGNHTEEPLLTAQ